MKNIQGINSEIQFVKTLKMVTEAYQDISVTRMQKIRVSVLKTRDYLNNFTEMFYDVKSSYKKEILKLMKKKKSKDLSKLSIITKNGKTVSVLISANSKLHGDIVTKVMRLFMEEIQKNDSDIVIIGRLGRVFFEQSQLKKPYMYFEIPDMDLTTEDIKPIVYNIVKYEKINIYYGKFENIISQVPAVTNITGHELDAGGISKTHTAVKEKQYIFEPSLERILEFFETQIFSSLFKQSINESQLARFASRLRGMEEALNNITIKSQNLYTERRKMKRLTDNKKQLETMSGISLWIK